MRETARAAEVDLIVAIFPESYQVGAGAADLVPQQRLLEACQTLDLDCIDLQPVFTAVGGPLFTDTQHPNGAGHRVAGEALAAAILAR